MTRITIPTVYVTECRHITITRDKGISVHIDFDCGVFTVHALGTPELEIVETDSQAELPAGAASVVPGKVTAKDIDWAEKAVAETDSQADKTD